MNRNFADIVNGRVVGYSSLATTQAKGFWAPIIYIKPDHNPVTSMLVGPTSKIPDVGSSNPLVLTYTVVPRVDALTSMQKHLDSLTTKTFQKQVALVTDGYTPEEVSSWAQQSKEAKEFAGDVNATTPMIDSIAASRGKSKADTVALISTNATNYASAVGFYLGRKQAIQDLIFANGVVMEDLLVIEEVELPSGWDLP